MLNYHELTMNEPRDSPARRKQFLVICAVIVSVLAHSTITSGILERVAVTEGTYPGGEFVYKEYTGDYAATGGLFRCVGGDLGLREDQSDDILYAVYIDYDSDVPMGDRRMFGGLLVGSDDAGGAEMRRSLVEKNAGIPDDPRDPDAFAVRVGAIKYEEGTLPEVDALVAQFPFTNGFVSALIHSYKVHPTMARYAKERTKDGAPVVISTTCSVSQQMCTHYAMLARQGEFFLGRSDSEAYHAELKSRKGKGIDFGLALKGLKKLSPFRKSSSSEL